MADPTESFRRQAVAEINSEVESGDPDFERLRLEKKYGQVWDTQELGKDFDVKGFMAPYVVVVKKETGKKGALQFQHMPRFYFNFQEVYS